MCYLGSNVTWIHILLVFFSGFFRNINRFLSSGFSQEAFRDLIQVAAVILPELSPGGFLSAYLIDDVVTPSFFLFGATNMLDFVPINVFSTKDDSNDNVVLNSSSDFFRDSFQNT